MMKEYWRKPEQTAEIFRGEWYCSGDVLPRDADGYFWFKGRNDDVIKASGYRISPFEVESCLVSHPAVLEAAAVESPDPMRGKVVKAFLVLRPGVSPGEALRAEIQEFARRHMAGYKYPRVIEFREPCRRRLPARSSGRSCASGRAETQRLAARLGRARSAGKSSCPRSGSRRNLPTASSAAWRRPVCNRSPPCRCGRYRGRSPGSGG